MAVDNFNPPQSLKTAVLFLVFSRIDTTKLVFQTIREAKPPRLYITGDGARENKVGEAEKVKEVRDYIMTNIDWECDVKTLFREKNLGCKNAVSGGITWFFENEEQGIILEDDCLPNQSFFRFCEEGLSYWKNNKDVAGIGGFVATCNDVPFFSLHGSVWGWATWKSVWEKYNADAILNQDDLRFVVDVSSLFSTLEKSYLASMLKNKPENTWDFYWQFSRIKIRKFMILPGVPLISNIGFDLENSTHTKAEKPKSLKKLESVNVHSNAIDHAKTISNFKKISFIDYRRVLGRHGLFRIIYLTTRYFISNPIFHAQLLLIRLSFSRGKGE